jgi:hypothetical protein
VPGLSFVEAGGHAVFWPADRSRRPLAPGFRLDAAGEALRVGLDDAGTTAVDFIGFAGGVAAGYSEGRLPDGSPTTAVLESTPGGPNAAGPGPVFTRHPRDTAVGLGRPFELAAEAPLATALQWRRNGADLPGETAATLHRTAAALADDGTYTCVATNASGLSTSREAKVAVLYTYAAWAAAVGVGGTGGDDDADGLTNAAEFLAGTNPLAGGLADRAAAPRAAGLDARGGVTHLAIEAQLSPRASYQGLLGELSPTLAPGSWASRAPDVRETVSLAPDGTPQVRLLFAVPAAAPRYFLRLRLDP